MANKNRMIADSLFTAITLIAVFLINLFLVRQFNTKTMTPMIFVLGVFLVSWRTQGYGFGIAASLLSVLAVNWAFTYPYWAFDLISPECISSAVVMLIVSTMTGALTTRLKQQEKLKAEAEKERMRGNLLRAVSHDLRTPLTIIKGYAESIKDITGDNKEIRDQQLTTIIEETDRLSEMVGSVMEYTKLSQSTYKLNIVQFDIADMCQDIVEMYNYKAIKEGKSISYAGPQQIYVFADAALIERVIHNFVSNALVHTPPETRVGVAINVTEEGKVKVSVYDSGQGIKQEDIPHLFDKYYRARKDEGRTGSGLGLAIVKSILENHNFQYGVESREGLGTEFWFII